MANDKTPTENQENPVSQVEETPVASEQEDEAQGLGKLYEENKTLIFGILAVGIAIGVFFFFNAKDDDEASNDEPQAEVVKLFEEDTPGLIKGFFNNPPLGIEAAPEEPAVLLGAAAEFDAGNFEKALSLLNQWDAPAGYSWIKYSLEADIVSSLEEWSKAGNLYDMAIDNAPKDRPKIYLSLVLKDYLFHTHQKEEGKATQRKMEIFEFPDHHLYFQFPTENGTSAYSLGG